MQGGKTGFCRKRSMQTPSSESLIGWKTEPGALAESGRDTWGDAGLLQLYIYYSFGKACPSLLYAVLRIRITLMRIRIRTRILLVTLMASFQ
jgi:hypothetical protein